MKRTARPDSREASCRVHARSCSIGTRPTICWQQTNIVLCEKAAEFEPGTNFKAWAFRVAFLEVMNHRRNAGRDRMVFDETPLERFEAAVDQQDGHYEVRRKRLRSCMQRLRESQRRRMLERYFRHRPRAPGDLRRPRLLSGRSR